MAPAGKLEGTVDLAQHVTRPLVTVLLVATFCYGFVVEKVSGETFGTIVASVTAFWFAQRGAERRASDTETPPSATASVTPTP